MGSRRFVSRACEVCEWQGAEIEIAGSVALCPWCHAPTRVLREEWLSSAATPAEKPIATPASAQKNPHAAALGRMGGLKGGKARARLLSPRRRREIARKAAETRWRSR